MAEFNPGGAADLNQAVKLRYEANADTNAFTDGQQSKLAGIAAGATANATDAQLRDRATHTGTQTIATVTGLQAALDAKSDTGHIHIIAQVTGLQAALDSKADAAHGHAIADVTGLQGALDGKAATSHTHPAAAISDSSAAGRAMLTAADAAAQSALLDIFTPSLKGLAPASGGGTANVLRADGTWAAPPGGGGGNAWADPVDANIVPDADGTRDLGSTGTRFDQGYVDELHVTEGIVLTEAADHPVAPAAGLGQLWVRNDATQKLMFTDDAGADKEVVFANGGAALDAFTGLLGLNSGAAVDVTTLALVEARVPGLTAGIRQAEMEAQSTASYSLVAADSGKTKRHTSASATTVTLPANATTALATGHTSNHLQFTSIGDIFADDIHVNSIGQYAMTCLVWACLYHRNPSELPNTIDPSDTLTTTQAAYLKSVAWEVPRGYARAGVP